MQNNVEESNNKIEIAKSAGMATGFTTTMVSTLGLSQFAALSMTTGMPLFGGAILGVLLFAIPVVNLQSRIDKKFDPKVESKQTANACYNFVLAASTMVLAVLVGLAMVSAFMSIVANPFTLPALIAGGISVALMIGVYVGTAPDSSSDEFALPSSEAIRNIDHWDGAFGTTSSGPGMYNRRMML